MNLLPCKIANGEINLAGQRIASNTSIKKNNFEKTQVGIRPEFVNFSKDGIPVKVLKVNNIGRHRIVDVETGSGKIKILSNPQDEIPSGSAFVTFNQKYTYAYGDDWIIE
jgi:glycerol transport system ATP-binding protein